MLYFLLLLSTAAAFLPSTPTTTRARSNSVLFEIPEPDARNPDKPELPLVPGDYDWDAKYANDPDWMVGNNIPGRRTLNELELAQQTTAMTNLEETWRKSRAIAEYEEELNVGFVPKAELLNGRFAMFFLVTGLLTEYWTGVSLPGQVEEMLRIGGVIGFDN